MGHISDSSPASASQEKTSALEAEIVKHEKTISELQRTTSATEQKVTNIEKEMILVKEALGQLLKMGLERTGRREEEGRENRELNSLFSLTEDTLSSSTNPSASNISTKERKDLKQKRFEIPLPQTLKLPVYEGQNPSNWVFQVEMCFAVNKTPEEEKLNLAMACMEGRAVPWARITQEREDLKSWGDFKEKLKKRFNLSGGSTAIRQILRLKQTGSVTEYRQLFEERSAEIPNVPNDALVEFFVNGLKESLREEVFRYLPCGMDKIVDMAMMIEEQEAEEGEE